MDTRTLPACTSTTRNRRVGLVQRAQEFQPLVHADLSVPDHLQDSVLLTHCIILTPFLLVRLTCVTITMLIMGEGIALRRPLL